VIPVQGTQATTYIYAGDRWQDPDLVGSKYIWLPIKISGNSLSLDYYAEWQLNVTTGRWSVQVNDGFIPQSAWTLLYADSEETQSEDGRARNAFDDSAATIWHTRYTPDSPPHPHEIQIDLGANYALTGLRYLPRQDKDAGGLVAQYQFYASTDRTAARFRHRKPKLHFAEIFRLQVGQATAGKPVGNRLGTLLPHHAARRMAHALRVHHPDQRRLDRSVRPEIADPGAQHQQRALTFEAFNREAPVPAGRCIRCVGPAR